MCFHASFKVFKVKFICLCLWGRDVWGQRATQTGGCSFLLPCGFWERNSGRQAWLQSSQCLISHIWLLVSSCERNKSEAVSPRRHRKLVYMHVWTALKHRFLQVNGFSPCLFNVSLISALRSAYWHVKCNGGQTTFIIELGVYIYISLWFQTCRHLPASVSYVLEKQACTTKPVSSFTFYF